MYVSCKHCGKVFELKKPNTRYCSEKCRLAFWNQAYKDKHPFHKVKCKWCGKEFETRKTGKVFCNYHCKNKYYAHQKEERAKMKRMAQESCNQNERG